MKEQLQNIKEQALKTIGDCVDVKQLDELRVKYLGKKGELTAILKSRWASSRQRSAPLWVSLQTM